MYTKEDMVREFRESKPRSNILEMTEEMIGEVQRQREEWIVANPEFFEKRAAVRNAIEAYNTALDRGADQAELDKLDRQAKEAGEAVFSYLQKGQHSTP